MNLATPYMGKTTADSTFLGLGDLKQIIPKKKLK